MKIGLWGYYGFDNFGDDLILMTLLDWIQDINKTAVTHVFIKKNNSEETLPKNNLVVQEKRSVLNALSKAMSEFDIFIIGGGGIFPSNTSTKLLFYYVISVLMKIRKKSTVCIGVGVEEKNLLHPGNRFLLGKLIKNVDYFVIREEKVCSNCDIKPIAEESLIIPSADIVFSNDYQITSKNPMLFNIFLANIFDKNDGLDYNSFEKVIVNVIKYIIDLGYDVCLIPFTNTKDQYLNDKIAELVCSEKCKSFPYSKDTTMIIDKIKQGRFSLCMRFHAIVLSTVLCIPMCSISYGDKSSKLMKRIGLQNYSFEFGDNNGITDSYINLQYESIIDMVNSIIENERTIIEKLGKQHAALMDESNINKKILRKVMNKYNEDID